MAISGAATQAWRIVDRFPRFDLSELLTPEALARPRLLAGFGGCDSVTKLLLAEPQLFQDGWWRTPHPELFWNISRSGGKRIGGPMLIMQRSADPAVPEIITEASLHSTCGKFPKIQVKYLVVNGITHVPMLYAGQRQWLNWSWHRFERIEMK